MGPLLESDDFDENNELNEDLPLYKENLLQIYSNFRQPFGAFFPDSPFSPSHAYISGH